MKSLPTRELGNLRALPTGLLKIIGNRNHEPALMREVLAPAH